MKEKNASNNATQNKSFGWCATKSIQEVCDSLHTSPTDGLTSEQVARLQLHYGLNTMTNHEVTWWDILLKQVKSPFIYLLFIIAIIDFIFGAIPDGIIILSLVFINTLFGFYQEYSTYRTLTLLKKYVADTIQCVRDGKKITVATSQLVPGDIIHLYPGDKIPADILLINTENLQIHESMLTGESIPVKKNTETKTITHDIVTIFNATNIGFSGTYVESGKGVGIVFATGNTTYVGSINALARHTPELSSFAQSIQKFSRFILYIVFITISSVIALHWLFGIHENFITLITFAIALSISIIPEALPIVITFALARGAMQLAKQKVIVKRLSAIEDLGSMDLLCIDKTGTITENILSFSSVYTNDEQQTYLYMLLSSGNPTEPNNAFNAPLLQKLTDSDKKLLNEFHVITEYPFDEKLRYTSVIVLRDNKRELVVEGSMQEVVNLCTNLDASHKQAIVDWHATESNRGNRVATIAKKDIPEDFQYIPQQTDTGLSFIGLISYNDPIKPTAANALARAQALGVAVKIISGDVAQINKAIAEKIKLITSDNQIITGELFSQQSNKEKLRTAEHCNVFAHIAPDQKLEIIQLLRHAHDVGYLGDGLNDAPALKMAHVSIAVDTAADVARDSADIILLHKSLRVIVNGIHEGRIVFTNIIKYIKSTLAANFGHFYALSFVSLIIDFLPLLPSQLLLVSMLTDFPLIAISTDTVSQDDIKMPKKYDRREIALVSMTMGIIVMFTDFILLGLFYKSAPATLQTMWFVTSTLIELSYFYSIRTTLPFYKASLPSLPIIILSSCAATVAWILPFTQFGQRYLHFSPPTLAQALFICCIVMGYFLITDYCKVLFYRVYQPKTT